MTTGNKYKKQTRKQIIEQAILIPEIYYAEKRVRGREEQKKCKPVTGGYPSTNYLIIFFLGLTFVTEFLSWSSVCCPQMFATSEGFLGIS